MLKLYIDWSSPFVKYPGCNCCLPIFEANATATGLQVADTARTMLGTPFHHQGRLPGVGLDCSGLVVSVARILKLGDEPQKPRYGRIPENNIICSNLDRFMIPVRLSQACVGDVVGMWIADENLICHLGILTPRGMIHVDIERGCVEHNLSPKLSSKIKFAWRYVGVAKCNTERRWKLGVKNV